MSRDFAKAATRMTKSVLVSIILTAINAVFGNDEPVPISVLRHEKQILPCRVDFQVIQTENINVRWFRLTKGSTREELLAFGLISRNNKMEVKKDSHNEWNLLINRIDESDEGIYKCTWNSPFRQETVVRYDLQVDSPPAVDEDASSPRHLTYREGDMANLTCIMTGRPKPTITWYRLQRAQSSNSEKIGVTGPVLKIPDISRYAGDVYICKGENRHKTAGWQIDVRVNFKPHVEAHEPIIEARPSSSVFMSCRVQSSSDVTWKWFNNVGDKVKDNFKYSISKAESIDGYPVEISTLTLRRGLWDRRDYGTYKCQAVTVDHKVDAEIYLKNPRENNRDRPG